MPLRLLRYFGISNLAGYRPIQITREDQLIPPMVRLKQKKIAKKAGAERLVAERQAARLSVTTTDCSELSSFP